MLVLGKASHDLEFCSIPVEVAEVEETKLLELDALGGDLRKLWSYINYSSCEIQTNSTNMRNY
jgi:hypothetical protein